MAKYLSNKERKQRLLYKKLAVIILCALVLLTGIVVLDRYYTSNRTYTAEEMKHDHNGDGIPDH